MEYYKSDFHDVNVRIDLEKNQAFAREPGGKEYKLEQGSKVCADATMAKDKISKEEYYA